MDAGPGTDLGALGWYIGIWVTMMAAMMFPSALPMMLIVHKVSVGQGRSAALTALFAISYLAIWTAYGLAAYGFYRLLDQLAGGFLAWNNAGPYIAGGAIVAAGIYELTPLKSICLRHCRSPLHFVLHAWRDGGVGAIRMGVTHGGYCVGCCFGLMVVLFALGVMSLTWMAVVATLIFVQKVLPQGPLLSRGFAIAFVAAGIWVMTAPATVPGLTDPTSPAAEHARARMMHMEPGTPMMPGDRQHTTPTREPMTP